MKLPYLFPLVVIVLCGLAFNVKASQASSIDLSEPTYTSQMLRGGTGLLQTPTARMAQEGDFSFSYNDIDQYRFWSASLQLLPWMESTIRYTDVRTQLYSPFASFSGDQTLKDKGIDLKLRLLKESYYLPELSIGFQDIGGTGFFSSEFVALSKAFGPVDVHIGMGTGYLGAGGNVSNPFCSIKQSFCERPTGFSGLGGKVDFNEFFKGPSSVFAGLEYRTPIDGLRLKLEYEGNDYRNDRAGRLAQNSKWNVGAVYRYKNWDFNLNYQRGNTLGFGFSYRLNMHSIKQVKFDNPPRDIQQVEVPKSMQDVDKARLYADLANQASFLINATHQEAEQFTLYGTQLGYRHSDEANERVSRILASELPESIKTYRVVENQAQLPMVETQVDADLFKQTARNENVALQMSDAFTRHDPSMVSMRNYQPQQRKGAFVGMELFWLQTFGNPEAFYLYQGGAFVTGGYAFDRKVSVRGGLKVNVVENFDRFNFFTDNQVSALPRVRTQVREYVSRSRVTLENAYVHWFDRVAKDTYAQAYGGYLETMYAGVGGEIMYRPVDSNWYLGFDLNYVRQRDYDSDTALFDYHALTGHASIYWQPQALPDMQLTLSAGQFLAKDKGVNIDLAKRFDSGIVVGAYAAFTNVSAEEYGEGSFTKGFYVSVPFDLFSFAPAKGRGRIPWVPISRDGGQMLNRPVTLRGMTEIRSPFYD